MLAEYHLRESRETASRMLIPVISYLNEAKGNKTLRYYAFLLAAGDTSITLAHSYSELARKIGVTRAALSKAVIEMQEKLGLTAHNNFQKSEQARESSRKAARRSWTKRHYKENTHT
jgi:biotin operon repressor